MSQYSSDGVRQEQKAWRDCAISARHREYGVDCPAVDLDFLLVEFHIGKPVALIEYKRYPTPLSLTSNATFPALLSLAEDRREPLPLLVVRYWPDIWAFQNARLNIVAERHFSLGEILCERDYVARLYKLRRLALTAHLDALLKTDLPALAEAE
jgi:hypothetical protein